MPAASDEPWEIYQPPQLDPQLAALAGKGARLQAFLTLLARDPCHPDVKAYRLSGPLQPAVCGAHLARGYRIAFTMQRPMTEDDPPRVVVLYVGKREPGHRTDGDVWDVLHDLFGVDNPPSGHQKPPCCDEQLPDIDDEELDRFLKALRRLNRGR